MDSSPARPSPDAWAARPEGLAAGVPPPSVPLGFLGAAALGLVACGVTIALTRSRAVVDPTDDHIVGAAHLAMLATLYELDHRGKSIQAMRKGLPWLAGVALVWRNLSACT